MRKLLPVFLAALLLTGCAAPTPVSEDGTLRIVTTIWPEYQWVQAVLGENPAGAEVELLVADGVDPHSFQPAVQDILQLYTCDLLIYLGAESDRWVQDTLQGEVDEALVALPLMEAVADDFCTAEHDHDHAGHDAHHHEEAYDEHIWLSLKKAAELCHVIAHTLGEVDPANAAVYEANAEAYIARLHDLDASYAAAAAEAEHPHMVVADRFPFTYLAQDYGIHVDAAFPGCSAETEASFATVMHLAETVDEHGLESVLIIDGSDGSIARTVVEATAAKNARILTLHSMQSAVEEGETYLSVMERNLEVLKEALG
jgi:zinc transport system substrate-binding protein